MALPRIQIGDNEMKRPNKLTRVQKEILSKIKSKPMKISEIHQDHRNLMDHGLVMLEIRIGKGQFLKYIGHD